MVVLEMVRVSLLKFASKTCVLNDPLSARSAGDVAGENLQPLDRTRVSARARKTPSMGIRASCTQTSDGGSSFPTNSNLAITFCRHLRTMVIFSLALISQVLHCVVAVVVEGCRGAACSYAGISV